MVSARELIEEAERQGARFRIVGDRLEAAPKSALSPALVSEIGKQNAEVLAELHRRAVTSSIPKLTARGRLCMSCHRIDRCYELTDGAVCPSCAEWRNTCPAFVVLQSTTDNGKKGACLSCGGAWELHGEPHRDQWRVVDDLEAVTLFKAQYVLASARAIIAAKTM